MERKLQDKYDRLAGILRDTGGLAVAFSGGVDSVYLLHAAHEVLGSKVIAMTINSSYIPDWEIEEARKIAGEIGIQHHVIDVPVPDQVLNNPRDRCYLCKTFLFTMLIEFARGKGYTYVADGSNADDTREHRPGMKALKELGIISPLLQAGLSKSDIRTLSKDAGLQTWNKPAYACLLTRIPYDTRISSDLLRRIEHAETYLIGLGLRAVRVRTHDNLARIETEPHYIEKIYRDKLMGPIARQLKRYGFSYVTLDLEGYRTGGIEEILKNKDHERKG